MGINAKPFAIADKIVKRIFLGKPAIYADVDINQAISVDEYAFNGLSDRLGSYTESFVPTTPTFTQTATQLEFEVDYVGGGKLFAKKTVFDIPAFNFQRLGGSKITISTRTAGVCNFYLIAKRNTITFAIDNAVGGIDGTGFSGPLPSSNAVTYSDERVDMTIGVDVAPTLGTDEEVIALLCQIAYKEDLTGTVTGGSSAYLQVCCPDVTTLDARVFPSTNVASSTPSLFALVGKLADYVKNYLSIMARNNGFTDVSSGLSVAAGFTVLGGQKYSRVYDDGTVWVQLHLQNTSGGNKVDGDTMLSGMTNGWNYTSFPGYKTASGGGGAKTTIFVIGGGTNLLVNSTIAASEEIVISLLYKKV